RTERQHPARSERARTSIRHHPRRQTASWSGRGHLKPRVDTCCTEDPGRPELARGGEAEGTGVEMTELPTLIRPARELFGIASDLRVRTKEIVDENVPPRDLDYVFDREPTLALLAGFLHNRRVMIQGRHGTGKSSHVEQVASRLNWPCVRVNLDGHVSRMDLIGKDTIVIRDGQQITEFQPGILTWALQRPCALVFDEYDAGRADVMFLIQRVL